MVLAASAVQHAFASISSRINSVISRKNLKRVNFGIKVIDASAGKTVYKRNAGKAMIPASNMKIVTSAAAVELLGNDYKFVTRAGLLNGSLVVIGSGDPLLGDSLSGKNRMQFIEDIINQIKAKGIKSLNGIIIDSTFFDDKRVHPSWSPNELNRPYACEISGLNFNRNCISLNVKNAGSHAQISVTPGTKYVKLVNQVTLKSTGGSAVGAYRNSRPNNLIVRGKVRKEVNFDVAIERPALFFGTVLAERLNKSEINHKGRVEEKYIKNKPGIEVLVEHVTALSDAMARCNKDSFNMAAEALVKTISAEMTTGRINGEWKHGLSIMGRYLNKIGIDSNEFNLDDGCGLSRRNLLSPNAVTTVLYRIYKTSNRQFYMESLSVGGRQGTAVKYFTEPEYQGRVFGKTGYISGVRTFSGFAKTDDGDYIFSILTSGGGAYVRNAINDIVKAIIDGA